MRFVFFFLIILFSLIYSSLADSTNIFQEEISDFSIYLNSEKHKVSGGAVIIVHRNEVIFKEVFGFQEYGKIVATDNTKFALASLTKPIVSTALLLESKKGNINFDEKIKLPYLSNKVSLKNILSHSTGYIFPGTELIEKGLNRKDILLDLKKKKQKFPVGSTYYYSNFMYSLLEEVTELQTKAKWQSSVHNLFNELGIKNYSLCNIDSPNVTAKPHIKEKGKIKTLEFPKYYPKTVCSSAGLYIIIDDLAEFLKMYLGYRADVLSKEELAKLYEKQIITYNVVGSKGYMKLPYYDDKLKAYYGMGWRIIEIDGFNDKIIAHSGALKGIGTFMGFIPEKEIGIIFLTNQEKGLALKGGLRFLNNILNKN